MTPVVRSPVCTRRTTGCSEPAPYAMNALPRTTRSRSNISTILRWSIHRVGRRLPLAPQEQLSAPPVLGSDPYHARRPDVALAASTRAAARLGESEEVALSERATDTVVPLVS